MGISSRGTICRALFRNHKFKSSRRDQTVFSCNHFRKPCNRPNLYAAVEIRESCVQKLFRYLTMRMARLIVSGLPSLGGGRPGMSPNLQMFAQDRSEEELRGVCKELFIPQRDHGIDAHGAARRDIASRECDSGEDDNHSSERDGIRSADAVD
jgi:hypothetical protein